MMDFSEIGKAQKEAFDFLLSNSPESESVKGVSIEDAPTLMENLEKLHRYLSKLDSILSLYSEKIKGVDISESSTHLREFSKNINLDIEFLKRK